MTNREKFKETFGFDFDADSFSNCLAPGSVCKDFESCEECPFNDFWEKEYIVMKGATLKFTVTKMM